MKHAITQAIIMYAIAAVISMFVAVLIKAIFVGVRRISGKREP